MFGELATMLLDDMGTPDANVFSLYISYSGIQRTITWGSKYSLLVLLITHFIGNNNMSMCTAKPARIYSLQ